MADIEKDNFDIEENTETEKTEEENDQEQENTPVDEENIVIDESEEDSSDTDDLFDFEAIDVSEPRAPVREMDIIEEALAIRRRDWIKTHLNYIYAVIGLVVVGMIVLGIYLYYQSTNPMSRFVGSMSKSFSSSFHYEVKVTEDEKAMMSYDGSIIVNRSKHHIESVYDADYGTYSYIGAVYADGKSAAKGSYFNKKWTVHDCSDSAQDFFEFDKAFRSGGFDGGAFLRFTGLTSDYSTRELTAMVNVLKKRLSTNSPIATITTEKTNDGTRYEYEINLYELFLLIQEDGASVFYRATDYDEFVALFEANKSIIEETECRLSFVVNPAGYLSSLDIIVESQGRSYGVTCRMSNFTKAEVEMPESFLKAAEAENMIAPVEE